MTSYINKILKTDECIYWHLILKTDEYTYTHLNAQGPPWAYFIAHSRNRTKISVNRTSYNCCGHSYVIDILNNILVSVGSHEFPKYADILVRMQWFYKQSTKILWRFNLISYQGFYYALCRIWTCFSSKNRKIYVILLLHVLQDIALVWSYHTSINLLNLILIWV